LSKILDEGYGDAGFNDPVPNLDEGVNVADGSASSSGSRAKAAGGASAKSAASAPKGKAGAAAKPGERPPVYGAAAPPPEGAKPEDIEMSQALDQVARQQGFNSVEEYGKYLEESKPKVEKQQAAAEEMQLAPGIKKAPVYMPPGAYPGDRTKIGKEYKEEPTVRNLKLDENEHCIKSSYVKQTDTYGSRPNEGNTITYRTAEGGRVSEAEMGGASLPWALEATVKKMKVGDIMDVTGRGEYAVADDEELKPGMEHSWRFELIAVGGRSLDKFSLDADERIERANDLRLRGNEMFKKNRLLRAMDYYERGSNLMDVLEAEELGMPGHTDKKAAERNQRIWKCQQPLSLNWALILMKFGRWVEAERKCTEVLMDIEKECVKALFRRGQCNIHLGNHEQARSDLRRAAELDTSIAKEAERELDKVEAMQRQIDGQEMPEAKRVVGEFLKEGDQRSVRPPPKEAPPPASLVQGPLIGALKSQEAAAKANDLDEAAWCRQREAIYNQFLIRGDAGDEQ